MKTTQKILETSVINLHEEICKSRAYEIAKMNFEEIQKEIADNEDWDLLRELINEIVDLMYKTMKMKEFIEFIHKNNYED